MSETQRQADKARRELEITAALFEQMKANAVAKWLASGEHEAAKREELYRAVKVIDTVQAELVQIVAQGEVEAHAEQLRADLGA